MEKKFIIFDIESEYGHYRKINTTSSPLTYNIPPRTALIGMIGAILGFDRFSYHEKFTRDLLDISLQVLSPIKKQVVGFNLPYVKKIGEIWDGVERRTQVGFELLKNPKFRVFCSFKDDEMFDDFYNKIKNGHTHFSPYLGISQFTAKIKFVDVKTAKIMEDNNVVVEIISVINFSRYQNQIELQFNYQHAYSSMIMPTIMEVEGKERITKEFCEFIVELNGNPICVKNLSCKDIFNVDGFGNIFIM